MMTLLGRLKTSGQTAADKTTNGKTTIGRIAIGLILSSWGAALLTATSALAACTCFPCADCFIQNRGQLSFVVFDRESDQIRLVPNIRFTGDAADFAIVVPTPALPQIVEAPGTIWTEAATLTSRIRTSFNNDNDFTCGTRSDTSIRTDTAASEEDGVVVHNEETVGAFLVRTVSSTDSDALIGWLRANELEFSSTDSSKIAPLVDDGWFFTTMKLDTSQAGTEVPEQGWNTNVDPVEFSFAATEFVLPLPFLSINRAPTLPMVLYVIDDHRMDLPGFAVRYVNQISESEFGRIEQSHPTVAAYLQPGRFLTRLDRTFTQDRQFEKNVTLVRAAHDTEVRQGLGQARMMLQSWPLQILWMAGLLGLARRRFRFAGG